MAFTKEEKGRVLHFLSYPDWTSLSPSIQLGYPAGSQPLFLVEDALHRLDEVGEESVRRDLCECEAIEKQLSEARSRFAATQLGKLHTNQNEPAMLRKELNFWTLRLASDLGVVQNPYGAFVYDGGMGGGYNARVEQG